MKLNLGRGSEPRFGQDFKFKFSRNADVWLRFLGWCIFEILKIKFDQPLCQTSGPLCLWQCLRVSLILWWHLSLKVLLCVASNYQFMEFIDIIPDIGVKPLTLRVTLTPILAFIRLSFHHFYRTQVRSYSTHVSDSLTHSLMTFWKLNKLQTMQNLQTKPTKPHLPNQTYQSKPTKRDQDRILADE